MGKSIEYCIRRLQKDTRMSPHITLSMKLLKLRSKKQYRDSVGRAKLRKIKSQKNLEIVAFRLSFISLKMREHNNKLTHCMCANEICDYLKRNLVNQVNKSFNKDKKNKNPPELLKMTIQKCSQDIETFRAILSTDPEDESLIQELVSHQLYNNDVSKKQEIRKVTLRFCQERKFLNLDLPSTTHQSQDIQNVVPNPPNPLNQLQMPDETRLMKDQKKTETRDSLFQRLMNEQSFDMLEQLFP